MVVGLTSFCATGISHPTSDGSEFLVVDLSCGVWTPVLLCGFFNIGTKLFCRWSRVFFFRSPG